MIGTRLAHYEITSHLGSGGMGDVYQATDTRLGRSVAIKLLPETFSHDSERVARFEREARALASLNHPNIAAIYGVEESGGRKFIVMELVEGETLAERIAHGDISVVESMDIALQIAEALEAAHEKGIIHRDLKPANVKITPQGRVKVLDFGLAKIYESPNSLQNSTNSPTLSAVQTREGVLLGTAAYMSPEQARGKDVDRRSDVWAFGCVLYEMLTRKKAFPNEETVSDTLAGILKGEPDWNALPPATPQKIRTLLEHCLRKDARRRLRDMGDALIEIEEARGEPAAALPVRPASRRREYLWAAIAAVVVLLAAGLTIRTWFTPAPETVTTRFDVVAPQGARIALGNFLSPDGRKLAFVAAYEGKPVIWVRPLDTSTPRPLPGTEEAQRIFWSEDSQFIGFFVGDLLKKVAASGGPVQQVSNAPNANGAWNDQGVILLGRTNFALGPLLRVSAAGGEPVPAMELDASRKEVTQDFPAFLPDGRHFLYRSRASFNASADVDLYVGDLDSKERRLLPGIHAPGRYSPTGHVLFLRNDTLMAQRFDVNRLELSGEPFPVAEQVAGGVSVARSGSIAFLSGFTNESELAWFDRTGKYLGLAGPKGGYQNPELSPDGKYVSFGRGDPPDLWVRDLEKGQDSRITSHPKSEYTPLWRYDGRTIAYYTNRDNVLGSIYEHTLGTTAEDKPLLKIEAGAIPADWSHDGRYLIYTSGDDVWALPYPVLSDSKPVPVTKTPFSETNPRISPDGRWIAYTSNQSGGSDVFIQAFPQGAQVQVSTSGGQTPRWSADSKELYYMTPDLTLMAVPIKPNGASPGVGTPIRLFPTRMVPLGGLGRNYNVSTDGRFLINVVASDQAAPPITVILNWAAGLKK